MSSRAEAPLPAFRTLGHGTVALGGPPGAGPLVVADPWRGAARGAGAQVLVVTGSAVDAASPEDLAESGDGDAPVVCPRAALPVLRAAFPGRTVALAEGGAWRGGGVVVRAFRAAAVPRAAGFLPPGSALTYLVETGAGRFLLLGASDALPEHEGLAPDVLFAAVGGFAFPTPEEAAAAAARVRPRLAVPTHWGDLSARFEAARRFAALCESAGVPSVPVRGVRDSGETGD